MGVTLWDMQHNVDILEETGELPLKEDLRLKRLQWSDTCRGCQTIGHRTTVAVQTERKKEAARRDLLVVVGYHQQRPD